MRSDVFIKNPCEIETIPEGTKIQPTLASPQHQINIEMNAGPSRILDQADFMPVFVRDGFHFYFDSVLWKKPGSAGFKHPLGMVLSL